MSDASTAGRDGDFTARRSLAKSISAIESGGPEALAIEQRALQQPAAAHVLGITGPPGGPGNSQYVCGGGLLQGSLFNSQRLWAARFNGRNRFGE